MSLEAQVLIRSCLRRAPWRRPTAEALLQSVWIDQAPPEKLWPAASLGKVGWWAAWICMDLHASPCSSARYSCPQNGGGCAGLQEGKVYLQGYRAPV